METDDIKSIVGTMTYNDLKQLKIEATKKLKSVRFRDRIKFTLYLPKEYKERFEVALRWAVDHSVINASSRWAFTKFAVVNMIDMIEKEMEKERIEKENEELARRAANSALFVPGEVRQG